MPFAESWLPALPDLDYEPPKTALDSGTNVKGLNRSDFAHVKSHPHWPLLVRRERYECADSTGDHLHLDFYALYLVRGGRGVHVIDGRPYGIVRGDAYLVTPGSVHSYRDYHHLELDALYFQLGLLTEGEIEALREMNGFWQLFAAHGAANPDFPDATPTVESKVERRLQLSSEMHRQAEGAFETLRAEYVRTGRAASLLLRAKAFELLATLARHHQHRSGTREAVTPSRATAPTSASLATSTQLMVAQARQMCEERFAERLSVAQLAAHAFVSPAHFCVLWSREVGMPPAAYVRHLRLEHARHLLLSTQTSIAQVAGMCGFASPAAFSRAFRAAYHQSPRACRASKR